jgi:hypothetical protein
MSSSKLDKVTIKIRKLTEKIKTLEQSCNNATAKVNNFKNAISSEDYSTYGYVNQCNSSGTFNLTRSTTSIIDKESLLNLANSIKVKKSDSDNEQDSKYEIYEQNVRKTSVILFNLEETNNYKEEIYVKRALNYRLNLLLNYDVKIINCVRLGRSNSRPNMKQSCRPLKITLTDLAEKNKLIRSFNKVQIMSDTNSNIRKLIMVPNYTQQQRTRMKKLVCERNLLRKQQPSKTWVIRNWHVIEKTN